MHQIASITIGQVVGYIEEDHAVSVVLPSSQGPAIAVKILEPWLDGVRVCQNPLPTRGTYGVIAFPFGDDRNGVWLGAYAPALMDAVNAMNDPFQEYKAYGSNVYSLLDGAANFLWSHPSVTSQSPGGTYFYVNQDGQKPATYRHVVDGQTQERQRVPVTDAERTPTQPSPYVGIQHASGSSAQIDPSGNVTVTLTGNQTITIDGAQTVNVTGNINVNTQANAVIHADGNATVSAGGTATVTGPSGIDMNVNSGSQVNVSAGGGSVSDFVVLANLLVSAFNSHIHPDPQGGDTGTPVTPLTSADIASNIIGASS